MFRFFILPMSDNKYYHPVILSALNGFFQERDWEGLVDYLQGLTNKDFRMAGEIIGSCLMPQIDSEMFWQVFDRLFIYHSKAFLVTMLKAAALRKQQGDFTLNDEGFAPVAKHLLEQGTEIDRMKFITHMLQIFPDEPEELSFLMHQLKIDTPRTCADYFLRAENLASYYLLFMTLRKLEHDKEFLTRCCHFLVKKGTSLSFNLASIMKAYFDLEGVKGTFSLTLKPYQMGRMDSSYENFKKIMQSI